MSNWKRFFSRPPRERGAALLALFLSAPVKISLKSSGFNRTSERLDRLPRSGRPAEAAQGLANAAYAVMRRMPFHMTCLERSLVVWWLLGGDETAEIRLGVAADEEPGSPRFHAWVEVDGAPIDDGTDHLETYLPLNRRIEPHPDRFD